MHRIIAEKLTREGYDIDALHGDLTQQQRDKVMGDFREKTLQLLIATDVAARGIDVKEITHVINLNCRMTLKCTRTAAAVQGGRAIPESACRLSIPVRWAS